MGIQKLVVGVAESEELGNRNICRTGTLAGRTSLVLLAVGRKVVKKIFFLTWQKNRENVAEKCGEVIEKSWTKNELVKKISLFFNDNKSIN